MINLSSTNRVLVALEDDEEIQGEVFITPGVAEHGDFDDGTPFLEKAHHTTEGHEDVLLLELLPRRAPGSPLLEDARLDEVEGLDWSGVGGIDEDRAFREGHRQWGRGQCDDRVNRERVERRARQPLDLDAIVEDALAELSILDHLIFRDEVSLSWCQGLSRAEF